MALAADAAAGGRVRSVGGMNLSSTDLGLAARVQSLTKTYGRGEGAVRALDDVSVGIRRGQFTAIMGPSGSGKSTLMHIMAGLDAATSGRVWIGDTDITALSDLELTILRRRRVGFVFQAFNLVPTLDALGNILLPFDLDGRRPSALERARIDGLVETLGLGPRLRHRPHELSGGQQQRVAIARALATAPDLVFADEPTGNLDSRSGREVLGLLAAASRDHGQSIAMVTHDPIAASHADRVILLGDGRIVADKPRQSAEEIAAYMLASERRAAPTALPRPLDDGAAARRMTAVMDRRRSRRARPRHPPPRLAARARHGRERAGRGDLERLRGGADLGDRVHRRDAARRSVHRRQRARSPSCSRCSRCSWSASRSTSRRS